MTQVLKSGEPFLAVVREGCDDGSNVRELGHRWLQRWSKGGHDPRNEGTF